jgi:cytochrome bd-type quinol oxidase subunit 2
MVVADLAIAWIVLVMMFQKGQLIFRVLETTLKLLGLWGALQNRRWGYVLIVLFSLFAVLTTIMLPFQRNHRAVNSPLTWIDAVVQLIGGIAAVMLLVRERREAESRQ